MATLRVMLFCLTDGRFCSKGLDRRLGVAKCELPMQLLAVPLDVHIRAEEIFSERRLLWPDVLDSLDPIQVSRA